MADSKSTSSSQTWTTSITQIEPNHVRVRGYDLGELMGRLSFGAVVYLIIKGELPTEKVARLMDAMLVASIDHGVTPPSALATRTIASTGGTLSASVAAGIMAINDYHGGAIRDCAAQLEDIARRCDESGEELDCIAEAIVEEGKRAGRRISGFGHRVHTDDPRTGRLFELAEEAGVAGRFIETALAVERVFQKAGKRLPINVDGAIAAVLGDLEFPAHAMNGIFMIARSAGLVAHAVEEQTTQRPMRRIDPAQHVYDGPAAKRLTETADVPAARS